MLNRGLVEPLTPALLDELTKRALDARGAVLTATSAANSGHPGGSLSSMELYTLLYSMARLRPHEPRWSDRDRIVISHGHTSPGVYAALAQAGFFATEEFEAHFRQAGSVFEGHVERSVPGVEWSTGNLGQGLSAGVGLAIGAKLVDAPWHTYVAMSDGEQHKGQVAEARRVAVRRGLDNLTVVIDYNTIQISGHTYDVMPVPIAEDWRADGWLVSECDGHDLGQLHAAFVEAHTQKQPSVIIAHTVIGKGVSFMEGEAEFHGRALNAEEYPAAMQELGLDAERLERARSSRPGPCGVVALDHQTPPIAVTAGTPRNYTEKATDNRSAWGTALADLAEANPAVPMTVLDCDLAVSVKTDTFAATRPGGFVQCGVGEHNAATIAGAVSTVPGVLSFLSGFGAFGIDEVYNQQRLNDINGAGVKVAVTHCGLDVGEDGKTHQCLDYVGAMRNLFGWKVIVPADPNQTDRAVRVAAGMQGCVMLAMGRSKLPVITDEAGVPLFGGDYRFDYGAIDWARAGEDVCVLTMGTAAGAAVAACDSLRATGVDAAAAIVSCPLDLEDAAMGRAAGARLIVTVEDHASASGLGCSVALWLAEHAVGTRLLRIGVTDYQSSGAAADLMVKAGLDAEGIERSVRAAL